MVISVLFYSVFYFLFFRSMYFIVVERKVRQFGHCLAFLVGIKVRQLATVSLIPRHNYVFALEYLYL